MNVADFIKAMNREDIGKLYTALLRIDEVNLLGDDKLKELYELVKADYFSRD